jgi:hypothetical protein
MKKSIRKISLIATAFLCTSFFAINHVQNKKPILTIQFSFPHAGNLSLKDRNLSQLFALGAEESFKCYHYGLKTLFQDYTLPSATDLLNSIRCHPQYKGTITTNELLTHNVETTVTKEGSTFFLYEYTMDEESHFYLSHPKGLRHFTVKCSNEIAHIENGVSPRYPGLDYLIDCTASWS